MQSMVGLVAQTVPDGRVFGLDMQTLIGIGIQLLNGIALAVVLGFILYKPIKEFMDKRTGKIQRQIDDSDARMAKANKLIAEYDKKIKEIKKERIEVLEAARLEANDESSLIINEARQEAQSVKNRSLESIEKEKERLQDETRLYIIELASLMAEKYVIENIDNATQEKLFEETLAKLEETQWQS